MHAHARTHTNILNLENLKPMKMTIYLIFSNLLFVVVVVIFCQIRDGVGERRINGSVCSVNKGNPRTSIFMFFLLKNASSVWVRAVNSGEYL